MDPAEVEAVPAPDRLRQFVRRYVYANQRLEAPLVLRPKPTGYTYFANYFGSSSAYFAVVDGQRFPLTSRWHLPGQIVDHDIAAHHPDTFEALYCELSATALHRLFGVPGEKTTGKPPPLSEIGEGFEALARKHFVLGAEGTRDQHVGEANAFFSELAESAGPGDPLVEEAVGLFEVANGAVRVADVCQQLGTDPRHLNRRFNHIVGVSPKFFGQVLQVNWVVGLLYFNDTATLTDIAHTAGFHDLSHFHRTMRRFFNEGPREFLQSDHVFFKTFIGASRRFGPAAPETD